MYTLGYDFRDPWIPYDHLQFALRLSTRDNLYAPDASTMRIRLQDDVLHMHAQGLWSAGGQRRCRGEAALCIERGQDGSIRVTGSASHAGEDAQTLLLLVRGMPIRSIVGESSNMPAFELAKGEGAGPLEWPGRTATMPLVFMDCGQREYYALSRDDRVRRKAFAAYRDPFTAEPVLVLAHDEDCRRRSREILLPPWEIGWDMPRDTVIRKRLHDLEHKFGMRPFAEHDDRRWAGDVRLIVNLHGMHWTGYVFNTYREQVRALRTICTAIAGRHVLAFLPAWEGRYYVNSPEYRPAPEMGGEAGLRELVDTAHALGVHVIPMLDGPNLATERYLWENNLTGAILRDARGDLKSQNWIDWNFDLSREKMGWIVNFGHPGFCQRMIELCSGLIGEWNFDGVFLDGAIRWENCPDYSPYEGLVRWAREMRTRYPGRLLMAEDGYDLLWDLFGLFATFMQPLGLGQAMLRYTRQGYYLAYPAPGGSGGVHEQAWNSPTKNDMLKQYIIPTLAVADDTLAKHRDAVMDAVRQAADWEQVLPPLAHGEV